MRRVTESHPIAMEDLRTLARGRFGDTCVDAVSGWRPTGPPRPPRRRHSRDRAFGAEDGWGCRATGPAITSPEQEVGLLADRTRSCTYISGSALALLFAALQLHRICVGRRARAEHPPDDDADQQDRGNEDEVRRGHVHPG